MAELTSREKAGFAVSSVLAMGVKAFAAAVTFALTVVVARYLEQSVAGTFFTALTIVVVVSALCRRGLDQIVMREVAIAHDAGHSPNPRMVVKQALQMTLPALLLALGLSVAFSSLVFAGVFNLPSIEHFELILLVFVVVFHSQLFLYAFGLLGLRKVVYANFAQQAAFPALLILAFFFIEPTTLLTGVLGMLMAAFAAALAAGACWKLAIRANDCSGDKHQVRRRLERAASSMLHVVAANQIIQWAPQLALAVFYPSTEVALFAVAQRFSMAISFVLMAINGVIGPLFAAANNQQNLAKVKRLLNLSMIGATSIALPIAIGLVVFAENVLALAGEEYVEVAGSFYVLIAGQVVNVATGSAGLCLTMIGHEKLLRNVMYVGTVVSLAGSIIAVPLMGLTAAAWVTATVIATQNLLCFYVVRKKLNEGLGLL